jgi:hypothetical protein
MKKIILKGLVVLFMTGCCSTEKKSPIEGGWKLVYAKFPSSEITYPGNMTGSGVKTWTTGTFTFAGKYIMDTVTYDNYGWGTYKLSEGNRYEETILYHHLDEQSTGTTIRMFLEVRNDTLIQRWPVKDDWQLNEKYGTEKYVRLR